MFIDDIKLYAEQEAHLQSLISICKTFSQDIRMEFGFDKCATISVRRGKHCVQQVSDFQSLDEMDTYKYLGIEQNYKLDHTKLKTDFEEKYRRRLTKLLNSKLSAKNLFSAINSWTIPVLIYTFGVIKWSNTDLNKPDRLTSTHLTKFRYLHPNSSVHRIYLPRKEGGRGLLSIAKLCETQVQNITEYFKRSANPHIRQLVELHDSYTPLQFDNEYSTQEILSTAEAMQTWKAKTLHGKYPAELSQSHVDKNSSLMWLTSGYLYPETEGFITAIQDGVIRTRNYEKHILKLSHEDHCRRCKGPGETIEHISAGCPALAETEYLGRHNEVSKIIHQQLAHKYNLCKDSTPYYKYQPAPVLESPNALLYWDRPILTDKTVDYNRPDIVLIDKVNAEGIIVDIAIVKTQHT
nr:unnamed protein product [Callosobruchus analis]